MKYQQFYQKRRANYTGTVDPIFSRRNWWRLLLITVVAVLLEGFIVYGLKRLSLFSVSYYLQLIQHIAIVIVPFVGFLLWTNGRELIKRSRGFVWVGKFEVVGKQEKLIGGMLLLTPGDHHALKVQRSVFNRISVGDYIQVRRDAFGKVVEILKIEKFSRKLARVNRKRRQKDIYT
jgi:hypothetical protein